MKNQGPQNKPKIVYFGTSEFAVPTLRYLVQNGYQILAAVTQPEKLVGRQRITMPSHIKKAALELNIPVLEPHTLKGGEFIKKFKHLAPDICIVAAYGKIIPVEYLEIPKYGFLNIHPSLLPKYRGPSPIQAAILNGDKETGVAIMVVDDKVDHGEIISSKPYYLLPTTYYSQAEKELAELGGELLLETLPKYISGEIEVKPQSHSQATFTKMIDRKDGQINWSDPAEKIYNQIRALNPEPGTWTSWKGKTLNISQAIEGSLLQEGQNLPVGTVVKIDNDIAIVAKKCYLVLKQIQLEGRKVMDIRSFINGHPDFIGASLG